MTLEVTLAMSWLLSSVMYCSLISGLGSCTVNLHFCQAHLALSRANKLPWRFRSYRGFALWCIRLVSNLEGSLQRLCLSRVPNFWCTYLWFWISCIGCLWLSSLWCRVSCISSSTSRVSHCYIPLNKCLVSLLFCQHFVPFNKVTLTFLLPLTCFSRGRHMYC